MHQISADRLQRVAAQKLTAESYRRGDKKGPAAKVDQKLT